MEERRDSRGSRGSRESPDRSLTAGTSRSNVPAFTPSWMSSSLPFFVTIYDKSLITSDHRVLTRLGQQDWQALEEKHRMLQSDLQRIDAELEFLSVSESQLRGENEELEVNTGKQLIVNTPSLMKSPLGQLGDSSTAFSSPKVYYPPIRYLFSDDLDEAAAQFDSEIAAGKDIVVIDFDKDGETVQEIKCLSGNWQVTEMMKTQADPHSREETISRFSQLSTPQEVDTTFISIAGTRSVIEDDSQGSRLTDTGTEGKELGRDITVDMAYISELIDVFNSRSEQLSKSLNPSIKEEIVE